MPVSSPFSPSTFNPTRPTYNRTVSKRKFGIELEYNETPYQDDWNRMRTDTMFGAKNDPSVDGGEFYSPPMYGDQGIEQIEKFCEIANTHNFECGHGAGYHLHLDMTNETVEALKKIALAYHYTKSMWMAMVSSSRSSESFCGSHAWSRGNIMNIDSLSGFTNFSRSLNRYTWSNWRAYTSHKTLEIRCHEATKSSVHVASWAIAHARFCDEVKECSVGRITRVFAQRSKNAKFRELRALLRDPELSGFLASRHR